MARFLAHLCRPYPHIGWRLLLSAHRQSAANRPHAISSIAALPPPPPSPMIITHYGESEWGNGCIIWSSTCNQAANAQLSCNHTVDDVDSFALFPPSPPPPFEIPHITDE